MRPRLPTGIFKNKIFNILVEKIACLFAVPSNESVHRKSGHVDLEPVISDIIGVVGGLKLTADYNEYILYSPIES